MATTKLERMPYTPKAVKSAWTNQTIRLAVSSNKRLKRAALKKKMSFNAWAVQILTEAADAVLNPKSEGDKN
jgi:predicted HicB family RNase H-like nuclease